MSAASGPRRVWVLNLDAEEELAAGAGYSPTDKLRTIVALHGRRLHGGLVAPEDVVLGEHPLDARQRDAIRGLPGMAWSPTPRARALLEGAGARLGPLPSTGALRAVNARPFAARVRAPLADTCFPKRIVASLEETLEVLAGPAELGWLVRRTFGAAGRGRRRLPSGSCSPAERAWLVASLRIGPLVIEPWVHVTREHTRSAWVRRDGELVISPPCFQRTSSGGTWLGSERAEAGALGASDDIRLEAAVAAAGRALAASGYFGPFGIDAFHYRSGRHELLNPLSEINARFTMDWTTAMIDGRTESHRERRVDVFLERAREG